MPTPKKTFVPTRLADYSEQSILAEIRRVVLEECAGIVPARDRFEKLARVSRVTIAKRFGTYKKGIQQAGFSLHRQSPRPIVTKKQVEANLLDVLKRANGYFFSQSFYRRNGGTFCEETVKRRLGLPNWPAVMEMLGAKKKDHIRHIVMSPRAQRRRILTDIAEADLIDEIDRVWRLKGGRPTYDEFDKKSRFGITVYKTRFGSWTNAVETFCRNRGVSIEWHSAYSGRNVTKNELLRELRSAQHKESSSILSYDVYRKGGGTYSSGVFRKHFGSWTAAVNAAGSISGEQARYSRDQLLDEMQRLWELRGCAPRQADMWKLGSISPKCYAREFGSWTKAIHAFCDDRSTVDDEQNTKPSAEDITPMQGAPPPVQGVAIKPQLTPHATLITHRTGRTVSARLRFKIFNRDRFTCKLCGRSPNKYPNLELEIDHSISYSRGGETEIGNLQTLCKECNRGKADSKLDLPNNAMDRDEK
jgi:hypothetical protein